MKEERTVITEEKGKELSGLFSEFLDDFAKQEVGIKHLRQYGIGRKAAETNWVEITEKVRKGEDVTNDVIWKLFPYRDRGDNRKRGAWMHISGWITNLQDAFEKIGRVKPEDWPDIAKSVLKFYVRVFENDDLKSACDEFSSRTCERQTNHPGECL